MRQCVVNVSLMCSSYTTIHRCIPHPAFSFHLFHLLGHVDMCQTGCCTYSSIAHTSYALQVCTLHCTLYCTLHLQLCHYQIKTIRPRLHAATAYERSVSLAGVTARQSRPCVNQQNRQTRGRTAKSKINQI